MLQTRILLADTISVSLFCILELASSFLYKLVFAFLWHNDIFVISPFPQIKINHNLSKSSQLPFIFDWHLTVVVLRKPMNILTRIRHGTCLQGTQVLVALDRVFNNFKIYFLENNCVFLSYSFKLTFSEFPNRELRVELNKSDQN